MKNEKMRKESDSMGELEVPIKAYYGANTRRAELNFPISKQRFSRSFIKALAQIKLSSAKAGLKNRKMRRKKKLTIFKMNKSTN